jgi:uncharacterized repeat protein (TIGR03803 family)
MKLRLIYGAQGTVLLAAVVLAATAPSLRGQTLTVLHNFTNSPDGAMVWAGLVQSGNTLYGTTRDGGASGVGLIFSVNTDGSGFTTLHTFSSTNNPDGYRPYSALLQSGDMLYGTTAAGGDANVLPVAGGTVFAVQTNGNNYLVLHTFSIAEGQFPHGRLVLGGNTLFGTTLGAGSTGWGALFSVNTDGSGFTVLHTFSSPVPANSSGANWDGDQPWAGLALSADTLYGTATEAGPYGNGTIFSVKTNGNDFTVLHAFSATGSDPVLGLTNQDGALVQGGILLSGGKLYGTTRHGGSQGGGTVFSVQTDGTGFTVLHAFSTNSLDGRSPWAELVVSSNTLYGTTERGGSQDHGTVFSLGTDGNNFSLLRSFTNSPDAAFPVAGLLLSGNTLYGTSQQGGTRGGGTVFSLTIPAVLPIITDLRLAGTDLVITAINGVAGRTYAIITSPDVTSPLSHWSPLATNVLSADGTFSITATNAVNPAATSAFYRLFSP